MLCDRLMTTAAVPIILREEGAGRLNAPSDDRPTEAQLTISFTRKTILVTLTTKPVSFKHSDAELDMMVEAQWTKLRGRRDRVGREQTRLESLLRVSLQDFGFEQHGRTAYGAVWSTCSVRLQVTCAPSLAPATTFDLDLAGEGFV